MAVSSPNGLKTLGNREIAHEEQFLLLPQCFQKDLHLQTNNNKGLFGKGLKEVSHDTTSFFNPFPHNDTF